MSTPSRGPVREPQSPQPLNRYVQGVVDTFFEVRERITNALAQARAWWAGREHLTTTAELPATPREALIVLRREEEALALQEQKWRASEQRRRERAQAALAEQHLLESQAAAERQRLANLDTAAARAAVEQEAAAQAIARAEAAVAGAQRRRDAAQRAVTKAEQASVPGRARVSRAAKRTAKERATRQAASTAKAQGRTDAVVREATYPIPWTPTVEIAGVRPQPVGMFDQAVAMPAPHSRVVGATGRLGAQVDWSQPEAAELAAMILDAQRIPSSKRGGQVKHVAHGVLSKPNDGRQAAQTWTSDTAMRAARHYLVGQGADPDRHDVVVFVHSQVTRRRDGATKVEEAVHVLWSRVRDDGAIIDTDHAFVAAAVGRARYDVAAGIDPARIAMASTRSKPVRDGLAALKKRELVARYVQPGSMRTIERVPLQGREHAQRLAVEGHPLAGDIAGTWTPKPCYRGAVETRRILTHLVAGD